MPVLSADTCSMIVVIDVHHGTWISWYTACRTLTDYYTLRQAKTHSTSPNIKRQHPMSYIISVYKLSCARDDICHTPYPVSNPIKSWYIWTPYAQAHIKALLSLWTCPIVCLSQTQSPWPSFYSVLCLSSPVCCKSWPNPLIQSTCTAYVMAFIICPSLCRNSQPMSRQSSSMSWAI